MMISYVFLMVFATVCAKPTTSKCIKYFIIRNNPEKSGAIISTGNFNVIIPKMVHKNITKCFSVMKLV